LVSKLMTMVAITARTLVKSLVARVYSSDNTKGERGRVHDNYASQVHSVMGALLHKLCPISSDDPSARSRGKRRVEIFGTSPVARARSRSKRRGYKSAAPNTAPQAARAMPVHPRASDIQGAALDDFELGEEGFAGVEDKGDDVDGAAVDANESEVLSIAQNFWARDSAEDTSALQLAETQE